jgi:serine/threonine-protein kinase RsbT
MIAASVQSTPTTQTTVFDSSLRVLESYLTRGTSVGLLRGALRVRGWMDLDLESRGHDEPLLAEIDSHLRYFLSDETRRRACLAALRALRPSRYEPRRHSAEPVAVPIREEPDVLRARSRARDMAREVGFTHTDQIKIATAVSELARNIVRYAGQGVITVRVLSAPRAGLEIVADDHGPGIADLDAVLAGEFESKTGMGLGLRGSRQLMDDFQITSTPDQGTHVVMRKLQR